MIEQIRDQVGGAQRLWLVESPDRVPDEDPDNVLGSWLATTGTLLYAHEVTGVRVSLFEMPPGW